MSANPAAVAEYFKDAGKRPNASMTLGERPLRGCGEAAVNADDYTFADVRDGQNAENAARDTFVYRNRDGQRRIVDHHSSRVSG
jgi:hypothetical protein